MKCSINRVQLREQLPLPTPLSLHVFPAYYCNFKCSYCLHSLPEAELKKMPFKRQLMSLKTFRKAVDSLSEFPERPKALIFAGHGEPLIHKDIDKMVDYAVTSNAAKRVEIVTNASLLTRDLADRLVSAGLGRLRISIQGITSRKYKEVSGVELDFNELVENIRYFYRKREDTEVYIKIINIGLDNREEEQDFYDIFGPISDTMAIEYTIPFVSEIDYSQLNTEFEKCKQGHMQSSEICSMPFYMLVLEPNGNVLPCCSTSIPVVYGNIHERSLKELWDGPIKRGFLRLQLSDRNKSMVCKKCSVPSFGLQEGDYLDAYSDQLLKYYE